MAHGVSATCTLRMYGTSCGFSKANNKIYRFGGTNGTQAADTVYITNPIFTENATCSPTFTSISFLIT